ncbi:MAG: hypothetical protein AAGA29_12705 [Planctomycetota bacterium]
MSQSRHTQPPEVPPDTPPEDAQESPENEQAAGRVYAPDWVTDALIADTIRTWQPYYDTPLTRQDAIEMLVNVGRLFNLLEADHAREKHQTSKST